MDEHKQKEGKKRGFQEDEDEAGNADCAVEKQSAAKRSRSGQKKKRQTSEERQARSERKAKKRVSQKGKDEAMDGERTAEEKTNIKEPHPVRKKRTS